MHQTEPNPAPNSSERLEAINWLKAQNYPVLPVAPAQDGRKYPRVIKEKPEKGVWSHCPLTTNLEPIPLFTGKNPSYLDKDDSPHLVNHRQYQKRLPHDRDYELWFTNPANGIGTLGGWNNTVWLDFDVKQFSSPSECDAAVSGLIERHSLQQTLIERTHSGGWRIALQVKQKPNFTNFALTPGGSHVGEAISEGRFTVLAPTIGPSGKPYQCINRGQPMLVKSLDSIGIYPTSTKRCAKAQPPTSNPIPFPVSPGSISLESLGNRTSRDILSGANPTGDRSEALTLCIKEWYGWQNWAHQNGISISGNTEELAHYAGGQLGIDNNRVERILKTIDPYQCHPAALYMGNDESCWKKIARLDQATFLAKCPAHIKDAIQAEWNNGTRQGNRKGSDNRPQNPSNDSLTKQKEDSGEPSLAPFTLRHQIHEILKLDLPPSELLEALGELSNAYEWPLSSIRELAAQLETDLDKETSRSERMEQIKELEGFKSRTLTLSKYLPLSYAKPMTQIAQEMEAPTAAVLTAFLPIFASCLHPATRIIVSQRLKFVEPPIIYAGLATESGQRKSPLLNALLDALKELQYQEDQRAKTETAKYKQTQEKWLGKKGSMSEAEWKDAEPTPPSPLKEFYLDKTTMEAVDAVKAQQPDTALLWFKDELSGLFASYGAYKHGRGEDKESVLSGWNGRGLKKNLKNGERVFLKYDSMSILGAIQNVKLQKLMGNFDDDQGEWGRFLWCLIPLKALELPENDTEFHLAFLENLYRKARTIAPAQYRFAANAQAYFRKYHFSLEKRRIAHPKPGMRAAIAKMEGYAARLALNLHILWELEAGKTQPSLYIPLERVVAACQLVEFYLSQVILIHSEGAAASEGELTPRLSAILSKLYQFGELTARKLQASFNWLRKTSPGKIRQDLIELARLGYGKLVGKGNRLKLVLTETVDDGAEAVGNGAGGDKLAESTTDSQSLLLTVGSAVGVDDKGSGEMESRKNCSPPQQQQQHSNSFSSTLEELEVLSAVNVSTPPPAVEQVPGSKGEWETSVPTAVGVNSETEDITIEAGNSSTLASLKSLLLACQTVTQLQECKANHETQNVQLAYKLLTASERKQIRKIILQSEPIIQSNGERVSPAQFLSEFQGIQPGQIQVGDQVQWLECPGYLENMSPFIVTEIHGDGFVKLDIIKDLVPLCELLKL